MKNKIVVYDKVEATTKTFPDFFEWCADNSFHIVLGATRIGDKDIGAWLHSNDRGFPLVKDKDFSFYTTPRGTGLTRRMAILDLISSIEHKDYFRLEDKKKQFLWWEKEIYTKMGYFPKFRSVDNNKYWIDNGVALGSAEPPR